MPSAVAINEKLLSDRPSAAADETKKTWTYNYRVIVRELLVIFILGIFFLKIFATNLNYSYIYDVIYLD